MTLDVRNLKNQLQECENKAKELADDLRKAHGLLKPNCLEDRLSLFQLCQKNMVELRRPQQKLRYQADDCRQALEQHLTVWQQALHGLSRQVVAPFTAGFANRERFESGELPLIIRARGVADAGLRSFQDRQQQLIHTYSRIVEAANQDVARSWQATPETSNDNGIRLPSI